MLKRFALLVVFTSLSSGVAALEVSSIVSCKQEGEGWLCAAWRNGAIEVFRSEHYITKVEFATEVGPPLTDPAAMLPPADSAPGLAAPAIYTLQLLACNSGACRRQMDKIRSIPNAKVVEIKSQGKLWQVLIVGEYASQKSAQIAAAELMSRYQLRDKPWVRSLQSLHRREVAH